MPAVAAADEVESERGAGAQDLADEAEHGEREGEAEADTDAVQRTGAGAVLGGEGFRTAEDDAVHHDERDEQAQGLIDSRRIGLHQQLQQRDEGCDDNDVHRDMHLVRNDRRNQGDNHVRQDQDKVVVASVGHMPSSRTKVGLFLTRPSVMSFQFLAIV